MEPSPPVRAVLPRRGVLRGTVLAPVVAGLASGCTRSPPEEPDPLEPLVESARSDARLADAVVRAHPELASRAGAVASVRREHARTLQREIDRLNPPAPETTTAPGPRPAAPPPTSTDAATAQLRQGLREAQGQAARLVPTARRYRAGLCGSVSAGCASLLEVLV